MNLFQISKLDDTKPRMNPIITDNFVYHQLNDPLTLVSSYLRQIQGSFGDSLKLEAVRMATPQEEIGASYIKNSNTGGPSRLKLDENNLYMVAIEFSYNGAKFPPFFIRVPYHLRGGKLIMDGRTFFNLPVLADRGVNIKLSDKGNELFLPLNRTRTPTKALGYHVRQHGMIITENVLLAEFHAKTNTSRSKAETRTPVKPSLFMYLLAKVGLTKAAKDYLGLDVEVIQGDLDQLRDKYSSREYTLYSSAGFKPRGMKPATWKNPDLHLLFKGEASHKQSEIAANFFYIYDYFQTDVELEDIDDVDVWKYVAGRILFNLGSGNAGQAVLQVEDHLTRSMDLLIDNETIRELAIDDIYVNDFYELCAWFIMNEKESFTKNKTNAFNNKRLVSHRYTLAPISSSINRLSYDLDNLKLNDTPPTHEKMRKTIGKYLSERLLRDLRGKHNEVQSIQAPTDNIWLNITRNVVPQIKAKSNKASDGMLTDKPENTVHQTVLTSANAGHIPKSEPTRKSGLNVFNKVDHDGKLSYDPKYQPILDYTEELLRYDYGFKDDTVVEYDLDDNDYN